MSWKLINVMQFMFPNKTPEHRKYTITKIGMYMLFILGILEKVDSVSLAMALVAMAGSYKYFNVKQKEVTQNELDTKQSSRTKSTTNRNRNVNPVTTGGDAKQPKSTRQKRAVSP